MDTVKIQLGRHGEETAVLFLRKKGYKILARNFRTRGGEIDIVAQEGRVTCFIEVKTRTSDCQGIPLEAITPAKQHQLSKMALIYLKQRKRPETPARFDIIAIQKDHQGQQTISLLRNAFDLPGIYLY